MKNFLFICNQNKLRSPTAEALFLNHKTIIAKSAGLDDDAVKTVSPEDIVWAEKIFVMDKNQKKQTAKKI